MSSTRSKLTTAAAIAAAAVGGATLASAATSGSSTTSSTTSTTQQRSHDPSRGGHERGGRTEALLTGDTAAKVKAAALDEVPGGTVLRVENDVDHGSPYEAHVRKSDGTEVEVLVDKDFKVTDVNEMGHR